MPALSDFRALLFDVDNTLVDTHTPTREMSLQLIEVLKKLDFTHRLGVCSGKSAVTLGHHIFPYFSENALHITSGGSQIVTSKQEIVWEKVLSAELVQELLAKLLPLGANIFITQPDALYTPEYFLSYLQQHPFRIPTQDLSHLSTFSTPLIGIYQVTPPIEEVLATFADRLTIKRMFSHSYNRTYCDITAAGVTKATAFYKWCEITGIDSQQVIGFGDSENDLEFFDSVGYAVAMGNAVPAIKERANRVIGDVAADGLRNYLVESIETNSL